MFKVLLMLFALAVPAFALDLNEAVNLALTNNDYMKEQQYLLDAQSYSSKTAIAPFVPALGLGYGYSDTSTSNPSDMGDETSNLRVELTYNLFNGLNDWSNYRMSSATLDRQRYTYRSSMQDVLLNTKNAYIDYLKAKKQYDIAVESLALLDEQYRITELQMQAGELQQSDLLMVQVEQASQRLAVLDADISTKTARKQLELQIGRYITEGETVEDIAISASYAIPPLDDLRAQLEEKHSTLGAARAAHEAAIYAKDKSRSAFMPKVDLGYSYTYYGDDFSPSGRDDSYDSAGVLSLSASWNLFRGLGDMNSYISQSKTADASAYAFSHQRRILITDLESTYDRYLYAWESIAVSEVGVQQARENYRVMELRYKNSEATAADLLDANVALSKALNAYSTAQYNYISAIASLEKAAEGNFLGLDMVL